jgi:hypothetical protein
LKNATQKKGGGKQTLITVEKNATWIEFTKKTHQQKQQHQVFYLKALLIAIFYEALVWWLDRNFFGK